MKIVLTFFYLAYFVAMYTMFGINGGVHRYWCHKSYKANLPLRMILAWCYLTAAQVHYKYLKFLIFKILRQLEFFIFKIFSKVCV